MELKDMVQQLLDKHGFTQDSLAKRAGCSQPTIGRILKGTDPGYTTGRVLENLFAEKQKQAA